MIKILSLIISYILGIFTKIFEREFYLEQSRTRLKNNFILPTIGQHMKYNIEQQQNK